MEQPKQAALESARLSAQQAALESDRLKAQQAADELRDLILLEQLSPGAPIPEREMSDALGVSRTPLRESLRILSTEGLVESWFSSGLHAM